MACSSVVSAAVSPPAVHATWRGDYGENRLLKAYLRGPSSFRAYVADMRADPREGEGI